MTRLESYYQDTLAPSLMEKFGYQSVMQAPRITKITLNMGVGEALVNKNAMESAVADLSAISGQKPIVTKARKSVANFKVREGWSVGCKVTLRRERLYEFLDRLISIALPRVRDFRGITPKAFDGRGNYTLGLKEQLVFPEIEYSKVDKITGMNITLVTTAKTDQEGLLLLKKMGMPFHD